MIPIDSIEYEAPVDTRRYWSGVALFVIALLVAIVLVVLQGSHAGVRARRLVPQPGSEVSVNPRIQLLFARPIDKASIEGAVRLVPEVPVDLAWSENELRILPRQALQAGTEYTVIVGPEIRDSGGQPLEGQLEWRFRTRQPRVTYVQPGPEGTDELWMTDLEGQNSHRLSAPGQLVRDYDVSPDGSMIVYTVEDGTGSINLWRADVERQGLTRLTEEEKVLYNGPRFSPTGDLVAVEVRREVSIGDQGATLAPPKLELRRPGDGSPAGLIYGTGQEVGHTSRWSPDGTRIAFVESAQGGLGIFNFTSETRFFPGESIALGTQAWSPDGRAVVYTQMLLHDQGAQQGIVVRDLQLGTEILLQERVGDQGEPAWSPDGNLIAYTYSGAGSGGGIWLMRPDGSGKILLVGEPDTLYSQPLWSPDGEWLLFTRFNFSDPTATQSLWVVRRNGSDLRRLADQAFLPRWLP